MPPRLRRLRLPLAQVHLAKKSAPKPFTLLAR